MWWSVVECGGVLGHAVEYGGVQWGVGKCGGLW